MDTYLLYPAMCSHVGRRRRNNEDAISYAYPDDPGVLAAFGALFLLSDGVGGLAHGEDYSSRAVELLRQVYYRTEATSTPERLARAIQDVNRRLFEQQQGGAATIVAAVFQGDTLTVASAGDSPAFLLNQQRIVRLTVDHVVETDQPGVKKLFRAMGHESGLTVDTITGRIKPGCRLLLCSDGITRYLHDQQLHHLAATAAPADIVTRAVQVAYAGGGVDNISLIMIEVGGVPATRPLLREHVARQEPVLHLPERLPEIAPIDTLPLYQPPVSPSGDDTLMSSPELRSFLRDKTSVDLVNRRKTQETIKLVLDDMPQEVRRTIPMFIQGVLRGLRGKETDIPQDIGEDSSPELVLTNVHGEIRQQLFARMGIVARLRLND
ncbi:MAG: SpoIIE family protein phosphatase, partial [Anaerolineae bacterium]|nr:SpoIIE family protein phosphatase [Anaerolineae bacterium]